MVENTAHVETNNPVANTAIDCGYRVPGRRAHCRDAVAGVTGDPGSDNRGAGMIGERVQKTGCRMAGDAFRVGDRVRARRRIGRCRCLANGSNAVVTPRATAGNAGVIKTAVRCQVEKTNRVVTIVAFDGCRQVKL